MLKNCRLRIQEQQWGHMNIGMFIFYNEFEKKDLYKNSLSIVFVTLKRVKYAL